jgi:DNA replication protein DnaC
METIEKNMSKASTRILSNTKQVDTASSPRSEAGVCSICGGIGYLRSDVPIGHPDFGRVLPCVCMQGRIQSEASDRLYRFSNLAQLRHMTFETFLIRGRVDISPRAQQSLKEAYVHAHSFVETRQRWLLLEGGFGCGKTHLAAAIANFAVDHGIPALFLTAPDILDWLRASFETSDENYTERFEMIRRVPLLVMDDFGTHNATSWAKEKMFQLLDYRYVNLLPTVITTNLRIEELEGRIRSRLADSEKVDRVKIFAPDYRQPVKEFGRAELSSLEIHSRQLFSTFSLREDEQLSTEESRSLKHALDRAHRMAESPTGWLMLIGGYGSGKTHLAAAIANNRDGLGFPSLFVVVPDLLDYLRSTYNPTSAVSYDRLFEEIRSSNFLVLDDLGAQNTTPWAREKLFQLLNHRYNAELPTVITSASSIEELDPRIRTRLLDTRLCSICAITAPAYSGGRSASSTNEGDKKPHRKKSR